MGSGSNDEKPLNMALSENRVQNAVVYHNFPQYLMLTLGLLGGSSHLVSGL